MKILWLSNSPWVATGYGNQTGLFAPRLMQAGHEVACCAFYGLEGGVLNLGGLLVLPKGRHAYGQDIAAEHAREWKADVLISLIDAWVYDPAQLQQHGTKWCPWFPVDAEPLPPPVFRAVSKAYRRIVFSRFGERMVNDAGLDCYYVPHGCDTKTFRPIDRAKARARMTFDDRFIVGMVAANKGYPPRKAFFENIKAFAQFHKNHPDSLLYLHTAIGTTPGVSEVNLKEYIESVGLELGKDVRFPSPYQLWNGFPDHAMVDLYNSLDVLLSVSMGEGFGIPILEAQACGTPVIVGDWTAMSELCLSGWKVRKSEATPFWIPLGANQYLPKVEAIADRLEMAWRVRGDSSYRKRARQGALKYDADRVVEKYWKPVLAEIEADVRAWQVPVEQVVAA
jgi:glycosyltransferase involved in cell wall biosynthesis